MPGVMERSVVAAEHKALVASGPTGTDWCFTGLTGRVAPHTLGGLDALNELLLNDLSSEDTGDH